MSGDMKIVIWDTETTDRGSQDEVIQFSSIVTNMDLDIVGYIDRYCFTNVQISPAAENTHGINRKLLYELSGGKYFEDMLEEIPILRTGNFVFIAYNRKFDQRLVNQTLTNNGLDKFNFGKRMDGFLKRNLPLGRYNYCAMELLSKAINGGQVRPLEELCRTKSGETAESLQIKFRNFCKLFNIPVDEKAKAHNALFDSFMTWVLLSSNKGLIYS